MLWRTGPWSVNKVLPSRRHLPFHSQEWSISNFPCSLTRNITSHIIAHSDKRWLYYQFSPHHLTHFSLRGWENVFCEPGGTGLTTKIVCHQLYSCFSVTLWACYGVICALNKGREFRNTKYAFYLQRRRRYQETYNFLTLDDDVIRASVLFLIATWNQSDSRMSPLL